MSTEDLESRRSSVLNRTPGDSPGVYTGSKEFPKQYYIGLYGFANVGKTSLINSVLYAVQGKLREEVWFEAATAETQGTQTIRRAKVKVSNTIYLVDNRGFTPEKWKDDLTKNEIRAQIGKQIMFLYQQ